MKDFPSYFLFHPILLLMMIWVGTLNSTTDAKEHSTPHKGIRSQAQTQDLCSTPHPHQELSLTCWLFNVNELLDRGKISSRKPIEFNVTADVENIGTLSHLVVVQKSGDRHFEKYIREFFGILSQKKYLTQLEIRKLHLSGLIDQHTIALNTTFEFDTTERARQSAVIYNALLMMMSLRSKDRDVRALLAGVRINPIDNQLRLNLRLPRTLTEALLNKNRLRNGVFEEHPERVTPVPMDPEPSAVPGATLGRGRITGRVFDQTGRPANASQIFIYPKPGKALNVSVPNDLILTDSNGGFEIRGLGSGEYIVCAIEKGYSDENIERAMRDHTPLQITYYGDVINDWQASTVKVEDDAATSGIDIHLTALPLHRLEGVVLDSPCGLPVKDELDSPCGLPVKDAFVQIYRKTEHEKGPNNMLSTHTDGRGRWFFLVPEGTYILRISLHPEQISPLVKNMVAFKVQQVEVSGATGSTTDVLLNMSRRDEIISGIVVTDDGKPLLPEVSVTVIPITQDAQHSLFGLHGEVQPDGSFSVDELQSAKQFLSIFIQPDGLYYVKSITSGGRDHLIEPFEIGYGIYYGDVKVVLSRDVATLEGRLQHSDGAIPQGKTRIRLIPADWKNWSVPSTWRWTIANDGGFTIHCSPGEYMIFTEDLDYEPKVDSPEGAREYIDKHASTAHFVTLQPNEKKMITLQIP